MVCSVLLLTGLWKNSIGPSRSATVELAQPREETTRARALAILGAWDERRAKAYAQGDADALVELYLAGSDSGENDRQLLTTYLARGLRVQGMRTQILDLEIRPA